MAEGVNYIIKLWAFFRRLWYKTLLPFLYSSFFFFWYVHKEYNSYSQNNDGLIDTLLGPKGPTSMDDSVEFLRAWMFGSHWKPHGFIFFFFQICSPVCMNGRKPKPWFVDQGEPNPFYFCCDKQVQRLKYLKTKS